MDECHVSPRTGMLSTVVQAQGELSEGMNLQNVRLKWGTEAVL